jgi:hypothetical protein
VLPTEPTCQAEHIRQLEVAYVRATALCECPKTIEVLREENRALEHRAAFADELRKIVVRLETVVEATCAKREAWCVSYQFCYISCR